MIIYRPHKGGLAESMQQAKEFNTDQEMKQYIYEDYKNYCDGIGFDAVPFEIDDIVIKKDDAISDIRTGWNDTMYVCIKRFGNEDYVKKYGAPQCIGMCANDYPRVIFGYLDKLYFATKCDGFIHVYDKISRLRVENPSRELIEVAKIALDSMED